MERRKARCSSTVDSTFLVALADRNATDQGDLRHSLLDLSENLQWDAQVCFRLLQIVMGDRERQPIDEATLERRDDARQEHWTQSTSEVALKIVRTGLAEPEMRDELFLQVLCQITGNPSTASCIRGWQMLNVLLTCFPPSSSLEPCLRNFLQERSTQEGTATLAEHACQSLDSVLQRGARTRLPSVASVGAAAAAAATARSADDDRASRLFGASIEEIMARARNETEPFVLPPFLPFLTEVREHIRCV